MHAALHTLTVIAVALGVVAAFQSHTLKRPVPTPNLYSPHSYLGITTLVLLGTQVEPDPDSCHDSSCDQCGARRPSPPCCAVAVASA